MQLSSPRHIESPLPHLQEAQSAATRFIELQTELLTLKAERAAQYQAKRIAAMEATLALAFLALLFGGGWGGFALYASGTSPLHIAIIFFLFFGSFAAVASILALGNRSRS